MPKLDQNLVFGEGHDKPDLITFLSTHMADFYARNYRVLVCELSGNWPVGNIIDESLHSNATLQDALDHAHQLVTSGGNAAQTLTLLGNIQNDLPSAAAVGSHKEAFGLLVRRALEARLKVLLVDYLTLQTREKLTARVQNYNNHAAPILRNLREKWLLLTGDEHVNSLQTYNSTGIVELVRPNVNVVGFRYQTINTALTNHTLQQITDLENVTST